MNYAEKFGLEDADDVAAARRRSSRGTSRKKNLSSMSDGDHARRRFSVGARVYDSELGVTCHWCRQKTVETHVLCTAEGCGKGRLPVAFCGMCLRNRHGEDIDKAVASGIWECPKCRGSCGEGCVTCCNCGPCRKANGLSPTHQVIQLARASGFDNVHDYLVHGVTGQTPAQLLDRKRSFAWGKWLTGDFAAAKKAEAVTADKAASKEKTQTFKSASKAKPSPSPAKRKTQQVVDVAAELRKRRAEALAEAARDSDSDDDFAMVPATPSPAKKRSVSGQKRPWAVALASRGKKASPSYPASPATPGASCDARGKRASRTTSREQFEPNSSPAKKQRQGGIRAMFTPTKGRATRARAAA